MSSVDIPSGGQARGMTSITARSSRPAPWLNVLNLSHLSNRERLRTKHFVGASASHRAPSPAPSQKLRCSPERLYAASHTHRGATMAANARRLAELNPDQRRDLLAAMSPVDLAVLEYSWEFWRQPHQTPPLP